MNNWELGNLPAMGVEVTGGGLVDFGGDVDVLLVVLLAADARLRVSGDWGDRLSPLLLLVGVDALLPLA